MIRFLKASLSQVASVVKLDFDYKDKLPLFDSFSSSKKFCVYWALSYDERYFYCLRSAILAVFSRSAICDTENAIWDAENASWDTEYAIWDTPIWNIEHSRGLDRQEQNNNVLCLENEQNADTANISS